MRMRKKPNLIPRMDRCRDRMIPDPVELRGHWRDLMPQARELRVELGCGKGRFTAETAGLEPDVLFVAVERVPDAMIVAMERVVEKGLSNVFFVDGDAARLRDYFSPGEADRIYINFCDPWPSNSTPGGGSPTRTSWCCTGGPAGRGTDPLQDGQPGAV